ncbi:MAG: sterol desaturase family protein [Alphaproteobacteria bacterium]|nr:sterol desaturase family protein [Alphaproteobacteria bacterium]
MPDLSTFDVAALGPLVATVAGQWIENFVVDLRRYVFAAPLAWLVICVILAPVLAHRKIRPTRPPARQLWIELACSVRSVAVFSTVALITFGLEKAGLLWGATWRMSGDLLPIVAGFVVSVVLHDAYFYWVHRAIHDPRLFRVFHRRHHRSHNPTPFTAYSFDLGEAALMAAFTPALVLALPIPWVAFGLFMLHQIARNVLGHCGYELFPAGKNGKPLFDWMTTVTHHDLHHAYAGCNYGLYFTWWDRWMRTEHPEYHARFAAVATRPTAASVPAE